MWEVSSRSGPAELRRLPIYEVSSILYKVYNKSLGHTLDLLELLSTEPNGLKMTEIGRRLDLNKSTIYRLLAELKQRGYVTQEGNRGVYKIGIKFIELVGSYLNNVELKTEAHPVLGRLNSQIDQTVYLAILQDDQVVYIDKIQKFNSFRKYTIIGQRKPLHCTSLGKSLLLTTPDIEIAELLDRQGMGRYTANTITDAEEFLEEIHASRLRGWTVDNGEIEEGVKCVAAPILDYQNRVIAAVSVSWFTDCCSDLTEEEISPAIVAAANEVSTHMGCTNDVSAVLRRFAEQHSRLRLLRPVATLGS